MEPRAAHKRVAVVIGLLALGAALLFALPHFFGKAKSVASMGEAEPRAGEESEISARDEWFFHQRAFPAKRTPPGALAASRREARALRVETGRGPAAGERKTISWTAIGPQPIASVSPDASAASGEYAGSLPVAGRVSAIATDPNDRSVVYIGGAAGGVWRSTDSGETWTPLFDRQSSLAIGAIVVDPSDSDDIWVGTGEPNGSGDTYYGMGIFHSTDGGSSWAHVGGSTFKGCFVTDLAIASPSVVVAGIAEFAGVTNPSCRASRRGVWRTTDGGSSWSHITLPDSSYQAPSDFAQPLYGPSYTIFLATYVDGVYKSTDSGASWSKVAAPSGGSPYRGVVSAYDSDTVYVAYSDVSQNDDLLWSVFKSTDGGSDWSQEVGAGGPDTPCTYPETSSGGQCSYDLALAVDPSDPATFFLGGIRLFRYSGSSRTAIGYGSCSSCIHVDQHALAFDADGRLWVGNDGGVYRSDDGGDNFLNRNGSGSGALAITEFNPWTSGSLARGAFVGGTQDNGTVEYTGGLAWRMTHGGDGGGTAFASPKVFYASYYGKPVYKTKDGGEHFSDVSGQWGNDRHGDPAEFYPPLEMTPGSKSTLYRGTNRVWRTRNAARSWSAISPQFHGTVSAIGPAPGRAAVVYAAWDASPSQVRSTRNATSASPAWRAVPSGRLPNRYVTDIWVQPRRPSTAIVTFSGFKQRTPGKPGHVYRTLDGGSTWRNISGNLPNTPVNAVAVDRAHPKKIFVGTDVGVFWTKNGGRRWTNSSSGLPNTIVSDLRIDGHWLVAATHGRSAFKARVP